MSGILATFGFILGLGLGFLLGVVVLIYGATKKQLARGLLGFILTLIGTGIIGAVYPPLSLIAPIFIMAVLIRWIAGSASSQKEYQEGKETENGSKVKKRSKFKYVVGAVGALIILGVIIGSTGTNSSNGKEYHYTCPADKYVLTGADFKESGWKIKSTSIEDIERKWKDKGVNVANYRCKAGGEVIDVSLFYPYVYRYGIYVFPSGDIAQKEFTRIKEAYLEKGSIDLYSIGNEGFIYDLGSGMAYDIWIRENNIIIGIFTNSDPTSLDEFVRNILFEKLHNVENK